MLWKQDGEIGRLRRQADFVMVTVLPRKGAGSNPALASMCFTDRGSAGTAN